MSQEERQSHAERQSLYFDEKAQLFGQNIPEEVKQRTREIVKAAHLNAGSRVLDVGTGAGVLIEHFLAEGVAPANIVGCDLSSGMLRKARDRYPGVAFWHGDVHEFPQRLGQFDAIFFNACFGNFFNQDQVVERSVKLLTPGGRILISHPLGARFVAALRAEEPEIVPHLLPDGQQLDDWAHKLALSLERYIDEPDLYIAVLRSKGK